MIKIYLEPQKFANIIDLYPGVFPKLNPYVLLNIFINIENPE